MAKSYDVFGGVLAGALIGATALFLYDEKNRKKIQLTVSDWKKKGTDEVEKIHDKVSDEIEKVKR